MPEQRKKGSGLFKFRSEVIQPGRTNAALVASARQVSLKPSKAAKAAKELRAEKWQDTAWEFYDLVPEFRSGCNWIGNIASKAELYVTRNGKRITEGPAVDLLASMYGGREGQSEMLRLLALHFSVPGESFLVLYSEGEGENQVDQWYTVSPGEIKTKGQVVELFGDELPSDAFILRLWRPHPRSQKKPDSPTRSLLAVLSEIDKLTQHLAAQIDSRLTSAGVLIVPSEISLGRMPQQSNDGDETEGSRDTEITASDVMQELADIAATALEDRQSAEALVPLILQVPGEFVDKVKHLTFWSEFDAESRAMMERAIGRLALGMDMPPEILTGSMGEMNHWNAWGVEEASIKAHTEPLLQVLTASLTTGFFRPMLELEQGLEGDPSEYSIEADTSQIRLRPNRSKEAFELYDRGELTRAALLREAGFDPEGDAPTPEEVTKWLLRKTALGSPTPEMVAQALVMLGVLPEMPILEEGRDSAPAQAPSLLEHPERKLPDPRDAAEVAQAAAVAAAGEALVVRALERAGNRLKTRFSLKNVQAAAAEIYLSAPKLQPADIEYLLEDAWSTTDQFADRYGIDRAVFRAALDNCARMLLISRAPLEPGVVGRFIESETLSKAVG